MAITVAGMAMAMVITITMATSIMSPAGGTAITRVAGSIGTATTVLTITGVIRLGIGVAGTDRA